MQQIQTIISTFEYFNIKLHLRIFRDKNNKKWWTNSAFPKTYLLRNRQNSARTAYLNFKKPNVCKNTLNKFAVGQRKLMYDDRKQNGKHLKIRTFYRSKVDSLELNNN